MTALRIVNYGPKHFEGAKALWRVAFPTDPQCTAGRLRIPTQAGRGSDLMPATIPR